MTDQNLPAVPASALPGAAMKDWAELVVARARDEGLNSPVTVASSQGWCARCCRPGSRSKMTEHLGYERNASEGVAGRATLATGPPPKKR